MNENKKMCYDEFKNYLLGELASLDGDVRIESRKVVKEGIGSVDSITFVFEDGNLSPNVYVETLFDKYLEGDQSIKDIAMDAIDLAVQAHNSAYYFDISSFNRKNLRRHISLRLVNRENNQELLSSCAYIEFMDLVAIPKWNLKINKAPASVLITKEMQKNCLEITDEELLKIAMKSIKPTDYKLSEMFEMLGIFSENERSGMYILTNKKRQYGSNAMMNDSILKAAYEQLGNVEFYIIPSSVHELIIMPYYDVDDPSMLKAICKDVNNTQLDKVDILGYNIYYYDGNELTICNC